MKNRIRNLPLKTKILYIIFTCILLLTSATFMSTQLISSSYQNALYQSVAASLSYSAKDLNNQLANINTMADMFLADTAIQNGLSIWKDDPTSPERTPAYQNLYTVLNEFYFTFRKNKIKYMSLYQNDFSVHTYMPTRQMLPDTMIQELKDYGSAAKGATTWVTKYSEEYGLFMVRDIRRTKYLKLDSIGTLIANVDLAALMADVTDTNHQYENAGYILYDQGTVIYDSLNLPDAAPLPESFHSKYGVSRLGDSQYFYVKGRVPDFGWNYVCLLPYDNIASTLQFSRQMCLAILMAAVLLSLLLSSSMVDSITRHFSNLLLKMQSFADGQTQPPVIDYDYSTRTDELGILHIRFDQMVDEVNQLIRSNYLNEILKKEAQLKALENQVNPHFLYNTLESINWRAKALGARDISSMAEALGTLLRITLDQKTKQVALSKELELVQCYMTIQKYRYENRLQYEMLVPESLLSCPVLKLTLQPLVENAIRYGLEVNTDGCLIELLAESTDDLLILSVKNNGSSFDDDLLQKLRTHQIEPHGFGIGLLNIHERMQLTYGDGYGLTLYNEDELAVARLTYPLSDMTNT